MTIIALDILFVYVILIEVKGIKHMTYDKSNIEFGVIQQKLEKYSNNIKYLAESSKDNANKKDAFVVVCRELGELIDDAKGIYFSAKKAKDENKFEQSKRLIIDCVEAQNVAYGHIISCVEREDPMLAFRCDGIVMSNRDYIRRLSAEKIVKNEFSF